MRKNKQLYYEILPADESEGASEKSADISAENVGAITPERDRYAELIAAADRISRVRFRVRPDYNGSISMATMFIAAVVIAGGVLLSFAKNRGAIIAISVVLLAAVAVGISVMIYMSVKAKRVYYCYYEKTERGVFCAGAVDDCAVVYAYGNAYRIKGDEFYVLDEAAFIKYLDGECCGILSVLRAAREDVEFEDDGFCFVKNSAGGGHAVVVEDGEIVEIQSKQPYRTDDVDIKTGEAKVKTKTFIKSDPSYEFEWKLPEFVARRLADNGIDISAVSPEA